RTRTAPSVVTNRSNVSSLNTARLNANALRLNTTRSLPSNTIRARSSNVTGSGQNFSTLKTFRTNNLGVRNFGTMGVRSFSTPRVTPNISGFSNVGSNMVAGSG